MTTEPTPDRHASVPVRSDVAPAPAEEAAPSPERLLFTPPADIHETDDGLVLRADLPGVTLETLELQVQENRLTLFGRTVDPAPPGARVLHAEHPTGDFLRSFILSDEVDHERIAAKLVHGVLTVFLPKAARAAPRKIPVQSD